MPGKLYDGVDTSYDTSVINSKAFCEGRQHKAWGYVKNNPHIFGSDVYEAWEAGYALSIAFGVQGPCNITRLEGSGDGDFDNPSTPQNLSTHVLSSSSIQISWDSSYDNVAVSGYYVYRNDEAITGLLTTLYYVDSLLNSATTYTYRVRSIDSSGNYSSFSSSVSATTLINVDTVPPTIPLNVTATVIDTSSIRINWSASYDAVGVEGYYIYKDTLLIAGPITELSYVSAGLSPDTTYQYTVKAKDTSNNYSDDSAIVSSTTPAVLDTTAPTQPLNFMGVLVGSTQIDYTWTAATDAVGVVGNDAYINGAFIADVGNVTNYSSINRVAGATYNAYIIARDAAGNTSIPSVTSTITIPSAMVDFLTVDVGVDEPTGKFYADIKNIGNLAFSGTPNNAIYWYVNGAYSQENKSSVAIPIGQTVRQLSAGVAVKPTTDYTLRALANGDELVSEPNTANNNLTKTIAVVSGDVTAPTVPTGLTAVAASTSQINVSWNASTDAVGVVGYRLYDGATQIGGNILSPILNYAHTGLTAGSSHTYQVLSYDAAGNNSAKSTGVTASTTSTANAIYVAKNGNNTTGNGTLALPYLTIGKAASVATAGKTVYIRTGTYTEQVFPANSGSAGVGYITYENYPGESVIVSGSGGLSYANWDGIFNISNKSYITIKGLKIQNSSCFGIFCFQSSNIKILSNEISNTASSSVIFTTDGAACNNVWIDGNYVHHISYKPWVNAPESTQEGISLFKTTNFEVSNNIMVDCGLEGFDAKAGSRYGKVFNNDISDCARIGLYLDGSNDIDIYNNTVHDSRPLASGFGEDGIRVGSEGGAIISNIKVYNNLVFNITTTGISFDPYTNPSFQNVTIYNNTVHNTGTNAGNKWGGGGILVSGNSNTGVVIRNNCISNSRDFNIQSANGTISNNLFYGGTVVGTAAVVGNPLYISATNKDFHLQVVSPAINAGILTGAPTVDKDGVTRVSNPDIGCYEKI